MKKKFKTVVTQALTLSLCMFMLAGCTAAPAGSESPDGSNAPSAASKPVLLVVSFGTSYNDNRDLSIGGIEQALQKAYPDYEVRRAFTSQIIIDKLKERDKIEIDNVKEAMDRLVADGVKDVVIQPTHVMSGFEYDDVVAEVNNYKDKFDSFKLGKTLLTTDEDFKELVSVITEETKAYNVDGTAIVFMGHGTEHNANATYAKVQEFLTDAGHNNYFVGTVEAEPALEDVIALAKASGATKVVLEPLMIVAGDHANNDMAGDEEGSWKTEFTKAGFEVECVVKGLGQFTGIQDLIVKHAGETIAQ
ncbi:MAG TPA: sirohydrochlorin cobaltochelatase [Syntrophomonas sp.]|nr:sirohydrochlorin cobaltochelatase [Syntrophomonas sp.]